MKTATIHTDGGARPTNPGPAACAYVIEVDGGDPIHYGRQIGVGTNNEAEYIAVIRALRHASLMGIEDVTLISDSKLVVEQMKGSWRVKDYKLLSLHDEATELADSFKRFTIQWTPRANNAEADALVVAALTQGVPNG